MKPNPLLLIVLFALLVVVALRTEQRFAEQSVSFRAVREGDAVVFFWRDDVEYPMSLRFAEAFDEWSGEVDRIIVDLSSPGGAVSEGRAVIELIDRIKRSHEVITRVDAQGYCLSMCVPIFLQGERRLAAGTSRWMFHQPTAVDAVTGEVEDRPARVRDYEARRFVDRYFRRSDMNPDWIETLEREWRRGDVWKSGRQLVEEESGVVTELM